MTGSSLPDLPAGLDWPDLDFFDPIIKDFGEKKIIAGKAAPASNAAACGSS